ncbi:HAMP domain-containing sensor histidine kinase [Streptococcus moroccensis]|uniref:histidine kinase n=1 Tax=Streptococcus moroccensis TaxID=1451356 RepID=A0ABT9YWS7_9STRE|nr:HAMP domain-containing sensor histidine kinase [Streptococcus moroccensis]MDQ0223520.1 two-component system sensor kinase Ihk [Streptococcus moroccensis]
MGIVRKNFLIVSGLITSTVLFLLLILHLALPITLNHIQKQSLKNQYTTVLQSLTSLSEAEMVEKLEQLDGSMPDLLFRLIDEEGKDIYPTLSEAELSQQSRDYLARGNYDEIGAWAEFITTREGKEFILQAEYGFYSLSDYSQVFVTYYPIILLAIVIIASSVAYVYSHLANRRIKRISTVTRQMLSLSPDVTIEPLGKDEIARLGQDINSLYQQLVSSIDELKQENERAIQKEKEKATFLQITAHELKTPIASLSGLVEGMIYNVGDFQNHDKYLRQCRNILTEQTQLVQSILETAKIDYIPTDHYQEVSLNNLLVDILEDCHHFAKAHAITLRFESSHDVSIYGNPLALTKAFKNLVDNAIRYSKPDTTVTIQLTQASLTIENFPKHMPSSYDFDHLFEPFYRPDYSRSKEVGGSGIGLYFVKQLFDNHQLPFSFSAKNDNSVSFQILLKSD